MPLDESGRWIPPKKTPTIRNHPFMPQEELLRKLCRIAIAAGVVIHEGESRRGATERLQRALASLNVWTKQVDVVHWVEDMKARGAVEPEFLA